MKRAKDWTAKPRERAQRARQQAEERARAKREADWLSRVGLARWPGLKRGGWRGAAEAMGEPAGSPRRAAALAWARRCQSLSKAFREQIDEHWSAAMADEKIARRLDAEGWRAWGEAGAALGAPGASRRAVERAAAAALRDGRWDAFEAIAGHWGAARALSEPFARELRSLAGAFGAERLGRAMPQAFFCEESGAEALAVAGAQFADLRHSWLSGLLGTKKELEDPAERLPRCAQGMWASPGGSRGLVAAWRASWSGHSVSDGLWAWGRWAFEHSRDDAWPLWAAEALRQSERAARQAKASPAAESAARAMLLAALAREDEEAFAALARMGLAEAGLREPRAPYFVMLDEFGYYAPAMSRVLASARSMRLSFAPQRQKRLIFCGSERGPLAREPLRLAAPKFEPTESWSQKLARLGEGGASSEGADALERIAVEGGKWGALAEKSLLSAELGGASRAGRSKARAL
jgi:hypothetical protein